MFLYKVTLKERVFNVIAGNEIKAIEGARLAHNADYAQQIPNTAEGLAGTMVKREKLVIDAVMPR